MKIIGSREMAMAPTTIFVLKRAPSCSRLVSAHRRRTVRPRMRPKTKSAAVMKLETAYNGINVRQLFGSNGTSSEPKVKTAASRSVSRLPPITKLQRCFESRRLMPWAPLLQDLAELAANLPISHDSHRTQASQERHLYVV